MSQKDALSGNVDVGIDEFLRVQSGTGSRLRATVEAVASDNTAVLVTPWSQSAGCQCALAVTVPRSAVVSVAPTGDHHDCCGKTLAVVWITFSEPYVALGKGLQEQVSRARTVHPPRQTEAVGGGSRLAGRGLFGDPCATRCEAHRRQCVQGCWNRPEDGREECFHHCGDTCEACLDGCPPPGADFRRRTSFRW